MPESFLPRREVEGLSQSLPSVGAPSAGINTFVKPIGTVSQQFVGMPSPYVATQQTANFINSLGQFNDSLMKFGAAYHEYDSKQQTMQAQADVMANPDYADQVLKFGNDLDKLTQEGKFPSFANPRYKMAFLEAAGEAKLMRDFPQYLQDRVNKTGVLNPDSNESIGAVSNQALLDFTKENGGGGLGAVAMLKSGQTIASNMTSHLVAKKAAAFDDGLQMASEQQASGIVSEAGTALAAIPQNLTPEERAVAVKNGIIPMKAKLQGVLDGFKSRGKAKEGSQTIAQAIISNVDALTDPYTGTQTLSAEDGKAILREFFDPKTGLMSGTGPLGGTDIGKKAFIEASTKITRNTYTQQNQFYEAKTKLRSDAVQQISDDFGIALEQKGAIDDKDDQAALKKLQPNLQVFGTSGNVAIINEAKEAAFKRKNGADSGSLKLAMDTVAEAAARNPAQARKLNQDAYDNHQISLGDYTKNEEMIGKSQEYTDLYKKVGSDKLLNDALDSIKSTFATKSAMGVAGAGGASLGLTAALPPQEASRQADILSAAQQSFYNYQQNKMDDLYLSDPDGKARRSNPNAWEMKVRQISSEAADYARKQAEVLVNTKNTVTQDTNYGEHTEAVNAARQAFKQILTPPQDGRKPQDTFIQRRFVNETLPQQLSLVADKIFTGTEKEQKQAAKAYVDMYRVRGFNPDLIAGYTNRTEDDVQFTEKMAPQELVKSGQINPLQDRLFQTAEQFNDYKNNPTKLAAFFKGLGISGKEQIKVMLAQDYLVKLFNPPTLDTINPPGYPR